MNQHPAPSELRELVSRTLDALNEEQELLEHLSECDECFQAYEDLWAEASTQLPNFADVFLDSSDASRLEARLFRRLHVASLATASSWLVTEGFLHVLVGVLVPVVEFDRAPTVSTEGDKS